MKTVASAFAVLLALTLPSYPSYAEKLQIYLCVDADGRKKLTEKDKGNCKPLDLPEETQKSAKKRNAGVRLGMTMDE